MSNAEMLAVIEAEMDRLRRALSELGHVRARLLAREREALTQSKTAQTQAVLTAEARCARMTSN